MRNQIGVVPQAPVLFDDTVMNNVRYAKLDATDDEVYEACKAASIHEQILGFADGKLQGPGSKAYKLAADNSSQAIKPGSVSVGSSSLAESFNGWRLHAPF